ncbi:UNKNOWN [Stylonychia lemnae]|uniref:Uncharacterized protein n=1 Tax=Stylonychia lemnae TaxID=5949 RepID=A0A078AGV3_STYLE|nr:UNKNOWN [Stylonychia lemnae]|eukprot:CDW80088.1 UNKNOWN [Stylonychia lemnae]
MLVLMKILNNFLASISGSRIISITYVHSTSGAIDVNPYQYIDYNIIVIYSFYHCHPQLDYFFSHYKLGNKPDSRPYSNIIEYNSNYISFINSRNNYRSTISNLTHRGLNYNYNNRITNCLISSNTNCDFSLGIINYSLGNIITNYDSNRSNTNRNFRFRSISYCSSNRISNYDSNSSNTNFDFSLRVINYSLGNIITNYDLNRSNNNSKFTQAPAATLAQQLQITVPITQLPSAPQITQVPLIDTITNTATIVATDQAIVTIITTKATQSVTHLYVFLQLPKNPQQLNSILNGALHPNQRLITMIKIIKKDF